jgi:hypothetical protein
MGDKEIRGARNSANVIYEFPEEYRPVLDTEQQTKGSTDTFDVGLKDLIKAGQLATGSKLYMSYKPNSSQERKTYEVIVENDGSLRGDDQSFSTSYAAVYYINKAGNPRKTANGWNFWKTEDGRSLADLRDNYINEPPAEKQWDEQSFFNETDSRRGSEESRIAREIFEWAKEKLPIFWWGRGKFDGSFFPGLEHKGISYYSIAIWTYGKVEIQFQWLTIYPFFWGFLKSASGPLARGFGRRSIPRLAKAARCCLLVYPDSFKASFCIG